MDDPNSKVPEDCNDKPFARVLKIQDLSEDIISAISIGSPYLTDEPGGPYQHEFSRDTPVIDWLRSCNAHRSCTECMKKQSYGTGDYAPGDAPVFMGPKSPLMWGDLHPAEMYALQEALGTGFSPWAPLLDILKLLPKGKDSAASIAKT